jgi:UDP-2-acetamido-3-amino-2,3-dideoxy-glucuronate N-acetyltransferase
MFGACLRTQKSDHFLWFCRIEPGLRLIAMAQIKSNSMSVFVHAAAICESTHVGDGTRIWAFAHVLPGAQIGRDCNICDGVFIENDVVIGDAVTIKSGVRLWDGVRLGDRVFVGSNATFVNDPFPRSNKQYHSGFPQTVVADDASIGANATVLPGVWIGYGAVVGAGSVVVDNVPARAIVVGNPSRVAGYAGAIEYESADSARLLAEDFGGRLIELGSHQDGRGRLIETESPDLPFVPKHVFLVDQVTLGSARGAHSHRLCHQLLIAVAGRMKAVIDDGKKARVVSIKNPKVGLYLPPMIWSMQFGHSEEAVLLVLASHPYDRSDYITDYAEFMRLAQEDGDGQA